MRTAHRLGGILVVCLLAALPACGTQTGPAGHDGDAGPQPDANGGCTGANACDCCTDGQVCFNDQCCTPACDGKRCGSDGCGGSCGSCAQANYTCDEPTGECVCAREDDQAFCEAQGKPCGTASGKDRCGRDYTASCDYCAGEREACDPVAETCICIAETESELCLAVGKNCGAVAATDGCGSARSLNCGSCDPGFLCDASTNVCEVCVPDDVPTFCAKNGAACGVFSGVDNCQDPRQVDCGGCDPGFLCNAGNNQCESCTSETDAQYCARVGTPTAFDCGTITATDNCNVARTFDCGSCVAPRFCDSTNHCHDCVPESDAVFCANAQKQCGPLAGTDSCGHARSVVECGPCGLAGDRCESGQCVVCIGETDAQLCAFHFKDCGSPSVIDSCGLSRTPTCGPSTCADAALTCNDGVCNDGVHPTNDSCASPQRLMFDPSGVATATGDLSGAAGDYYGSCGGSGNDVVYAFTLTQTLNVEVVVSSTNPSMQPEAYVRDGCTNTTDLVCGYAANAGSNAAVTARALPAGTYYLVVDGYAGNNGAFSLTVTTSLPPSVPANDTCAAPATLQFTAGVATVTGDTTAANDDYSDSCSWGTLDGPDVVYKFTVTSPSAVTATVTRDPSAGNYYPAIQLLATCPSGGTALGCAMQNNGAAKAASANLAPGDYYVVVDGTSHSSGPFTLEVRMLPPVSNDLCSSAAPVALTPVSGTTDLQGTVSGDTSIATDDDTSSCNSGGTGGDLVYSFEIPAGTAYAIRLEVVPTAGSGLWPTLFVKTACSGGVEKGCAAVTTTATAALEFGRLTEGTYLVFVDGWSPNTNGAFDLTITASIPPPAPTNDTCARPTVVMLDPATGAAQLTGSTAAAADDYAGGCANMWDLHTGPDLVYAVTAPATGGLSAKVTADPSTPNYQPVVYIQSVCGDNTTDQACANYGWNGYAAASAAAVTAGATYYVVVDGKGGSFGNFTLDVVTYAPLSNDTCATAKTMVFNLTGDFADRGDLCSASADAQDIPGQTCSGVGAYGRDVVYKLVTTQPKDLTVSYTSGQAWTSVLYLRTSCAAAGSQFLCNEAFGGAVNTISAKNLAAGEYYIWLDNAYLGDCGVFTLAAHLSDPPPVPSNDLCTSADLIAIDTTTGIGTVTGGSTASAANELNGACASSSGGDVVYRFTLASTKTVEIAVTPQAGSDLEPIVYLRSDCPQVSTELGCTGVSAPNTAASLLFSRLAQGTYYLVVDSYDVNATGLFDITVTTTTPPPPAANDLCTSARAMPAFDPVTLKTAISGDTLNGYNDDTSGCATGTMKVNGPDLVYSFRLAADAKVTATVTRDPSSTTYKPAIALRSGCALSDEVACKTDSQGSGASGSASVRAALPAGLWYVVVDGLDGSYGPFTLEVSQDSASTLVAGDSCANPIALTLTGGTATVSGDLTQTGLTDDYVGASCASAYASPDLVYALTLTSESFVTVTMAAGASGGNRLDAGSYLRRACDDATSEVACAATAVDGGSVTYTTPRLTAGTYYLFADASSSFYTGTFDLTVTVTPATGTSLPGNDACLQPTALSFTNGMAEVTGDTSGAFDDYGGSGSCGSFSGPLSGGDVVYSFTASAGSTVGAVVTRATAATGYLPAIYVRDSCASALPMNQLGCNTSTGTTAGLLLTHLAGGTYYLVVDGQGGSGGAFTLDVLLQSSPIDNVSCTAAQPLAFTATMSTGVSVAQVVGDTSFGASATEGIAQGSQWCYSSGNELYYSFSTTAVKDLTVDMTPLTLNYAPAVYLRSSCTDPQSQLACNFNWSGPITVQKRRLPAGNYTLVADSEYPSGAGPFGMRVTLADPPPPPAHDTCRAPQGLTLPPSGSPALVVSDSTLAANDDYAGGCANSGNPMDGGDVVYSFTVSTPTQVLANVVPHANSPDYRAAVYIRTSCETVSDDVCGYPSWGSGPSNPATVKASLPIGTYYLVVDGIGASAGDFDLELSQDSSLYVEGDHCVNAKSLDAQFTAGTQLNEMVASVSGTTVGASNDGDGNCFTGSSGDLVYRFTVARNSVVKVDLAASAASATYYPYYYLRSSCEDAAAQLDCKYTWSSTPVSGTAFNVQPGTYYLFVDTVSSGSGQGAFDLTVSVRDTPAAPANDVCRGATALTFVTAGTQQVATLIAEDSTFATHDSSGNCFWAGGNDLVYSFSTGGARSFVATVAPDMGSPWLKPSLYLRTACASSVATDEAACGYSANAGTAVTLRANSLPQGTYYLFVDSAATPGDPPGGGFNLSVTLDAVSGTVPANDNCAGALPIALTGPAPSVTTLTAQTTAGATDDTHGSCGAEGPDVVYYFDLTTASHVKAKVTGASGFTPAVFLRTTCATSQVICAASTALGIAEVTAQYLPAGRYFLWVDAGIPNSSGSFDLELTLSTPVVGAPPANDLCNANLPTLTKGVATTGSSVGAFNNYFNLGFPCGALAPGPDVVYAYTPTTDGAFTVTLVSNGADLAVWMTEGICGDPNSCVAYNDSGGGSGGSDIVTWSSGKAGVTYFIVVDSYVSTNTGTFVLTVN